MRIGRVLQPYGPCQPKVRFAGNNNPPFLDSAGLQDLRNSFCRVQLDRIAEKIEIPWGVWYADPTWELVPVQTELFDGAFESNKGTYISPGGGGDSIEGRYPRAIEWFRGGYWTNGSIAYLYEKEDAQGRKTLGAGFKDGRHRYAVMRDIGMTRIPLVMDATSRDLARKYGIVRD